MIKIPVYQKQVNVDKGESATPKILDNKFMPFISEKIKDTGESVSNTLSNIGKIFIKIKERQDENTRLNLENNFNKEIDNYLLNGESGILTKQNENAIGITKEYDSWAEKTIKDIAGDDKRFIPYLSKIAINKRDSVISHEATQMRNAYKINFETSVNRVAENIANNISDVKKVEDSTNEFNDILNKYIDYMGLNNIKEDASKEVYGKMFSSIVNTESLINPYNTKSLIEKYKDKLNKIDYDKISKIIDNKILIEDTSKEFNEKADKYFDKSSLKYNTKELIDSFNFNNMDEERKTDKIKIINSLIQNKEDQIRRDKEIYDYSFSDNMIGLKNSGKPMHELMDILNRRYSDYGNTDIANKKEFIRKLYDSDKPSVSNPLVYLALWTDIQDGKSKLSNIGDAYSKGSITQSDFESLYKEHYNSLESGKKSYPNYDIIKSMVDKSIKNDNKKAQFWIAFNEEMKNKDKSQDIAIAKDLLSDAEGWFTGNNYNVIYKNTIENKLKESYISIAEEEKEKIFDYILNYLIDNKQPIDKKNIINAYRKVRK